jgi:hypothetical protein
MTSSFKRKKSIPNSLKDYFLNSGVNYENNLIFGKTSKSMFSITASIVL